MSSVILSSAAIWALLLLLSTATVFFIGIGVVIFTRTRWWLENPASLLATWNSWSLPPRQTGSRHVRMEDEPNEHVEVLTVDLSESLSADDPIEERMWGNSSSNLLNRMNNFDELGRRALLHQQRHRLMRQLPPMMLQREEQLVPWRYPQAELTDVQRGLPEVVSGHLIVPRSKAEEIFSRVQQFGNATNSNPEDRLSTTDPGSAGTGRKSGGNLTGAGGTCPPATQTITQQDAVAHEGGRDIIVASDFDVFQKVHSFHGGGAAWQNESFCVFRRVSSAFLYGTTPGYTVGPSQAPSVGSRSHLTHSGGLLELSCIMVKSMGASSLNSSTMRIKCCVSASDPDSSKTDTCTSEAPNVHAGVRHRQRPFMQGVASASASAAGLRQGRDQCESVFECLRSSSPLSHSSRSEDLVSVIRHGNDSQLDSAVASPPSASSPFAQEFMASLEFSRHSCDTLSHVDQSEHNLHQLIHSTLRYDTEKQLLAAKLHASDIFQIQLSSVTTPAALAPPSPTSVLPEVEGSPRGALTPDHAPLQMPALRPVPSAAHQYDRQSSSALGDNSWAENSPGGPCWPTSRATSAGYPGTPSGTLLVHGGKPHPSGCGPLLSHTDKSSRHNVLVSTPIPVAQPPSEPGLPVDAPSIHESDPYEGRGTSVVWIFDAMGLSLEGNTLEQSI